MIICTAIVLKMAVVYRNFKILKKFSGLRFLYTSISRNFADQISNQSRIMQKLLSRGIPRKKRFLPGKENFFMIDKTVKDVMKGNPKRVSVLNNLFMETITDVMSTGEIGSELTGYGIEITYVKVAIDCKSVNVYWTMPSSNLIHEEKITELLDKNAAKIRSEACRLNLLGKMPHIKFVKDKQAMQVAELERLLSIADYGPDYIPVNSSKIFIEKQNLQYECFKHDENDETIDESTDEIIDKSIDAKHWYESPKDMQMDVFRLDHDAIMKKLKQKMKKQKENYEATKESISSLSTKISPENYESTNVNDFLKIKKELMIKYQKLKHDDRSNDIISLEASEDHNNNDDDDDDDVLLDDSDFLKYDYDNFDDTTNDRHYFPNDEFYDKT